jgi:hypothetical protein
MSAIGSTCPVSFPFTPATALTKKNLWFYIGTIMEAICEVSNAHCALDQKCSRTYGRSPAQPGREEPPSLAGRTGFCRTRGKGIEEFPKKSLVITADAVVRQIRQAPCRQAHHPVCPEQGRRKQRRRRMRAIGTPQSWMPASAGMSGKTPRSQRFFRRAPNVFPPHESIPLLGIPS